MFALALLSYVMGVFSLVCFVILLIKIFQSGQTGLGIACVVLAPCGIGVIIALVIGWQNADRWKIRNLIMLFTVSIVVSILFYGVLFAMAPREPLAPV
jgi:hypothetical protein